MAKKKIYINDSGTSFVLDCETDITNCSSCSIFWQCTANGADGQWPGVSYAISGLTNYVLHTFAAGDVSTVGLWKAQAGVSGLAGFSGRGRTIQFRVYDRFE